MKTKLFYQILLIGAVLLASEYSFSQGRIDSKKALDAFINATTKAKATVEKVQNAGITVELIYKPMVRGSGVTTTGDEMDIVGLGFEKKKLCYTDKNGRFSIKLSDETLRELPEEFYFQFTIKPENPKKYQTETNSAILKANKSSGPEFEFEVIFIRSSGTGNKGTFAVNSKAQN